MGEIVTASVSSREDHGYIMDIGSNTIRGFVPAKTMSKVSNECRTKFYISSIQFGEVEVGQVLWCIITRTDAGVRTLSPVASKVWTPTLSTPSIHNLYPGTKVYSLSMFM